MIRKLVFGLCLVLAGCSYNPKSRISDREYLYAFVPEKKIKTVRFQAPTQEELDNPPRNLVQKVKDVSYDGYEFAIEKVGSFLEAAVYNRVVLTHSKFGEEHDRIYHGEGDYWASFKKIHGIKMDDCDGGVFSAAALLSDDGFPAYMLAMFGKEALHGVFLARHEKGFGCIGLNKTDTFAPRFKRVKDLVDEIGKNFGRDYFKFRIYDLNLRAPGYIDNGKNNRFIFKVESN